MLVSRCGENVISSGMERKTSDRTIMDSKNRSRGGVCNVPDPHSGVVAAGDGHVLRGVEHHLVHLLLVTLEGGHHLLRVLVEHSGSLVRTTSEDPGVVRGEINCQDSWNRGRVETRVGGERYPLPHLRSCICSVYLVLFCLYLQIYICDNEPARQ